MALSGNHNPGDAGHVTDHNLIDAAITAINDGLADKVDATDARLTDTRVPTDGSVTNAKLAIALADFINSRVGTDDARLSDQRVPTNSSVTLAKLATEVTNLINSKVASTDTRLTDARTPIDASVTVAKFAADALSRTDPNAIVYNVKKNGAVGDGTTDDYTALQNLCNTVPAGSVLLFPPGVYRLSQALRPRRAITLRGSHRAVWPSRFDGVTGPDLPCALKPLSGFLGDGVIIIEDRETLGTTVETDGGVIENLGIDGGSQFNSTSGKVCGILVRGLCRGWVIHHNSIINTTGHSIETRAYTRTTISPLGAQKPRGVDVLYNSSHSSGNAAQNDVDAYYFDGLTDSLVVGNLASDTRRSSFHFSTPGQIIFANNTAAFSRNGYGCRITGGDATNNSGNGGMLITGFQTDWSWLPGLSIAAVGRNRVTVVGYEARRDGVSTGVPAIEIVGSSSSSLACPVNLVGVATAVEDSDDNELPFVPDIALSVTYPTSVQISGSYLWSESTTVLQLGAGADGSNVHWDDSTTFWSGLPAAKVRQYPDVRRGKTENLPIFTTSQTFTDMPQAESTWGSTSNSRLREAATDLRNMAYARLIYQVISSSGSANTPVVYAQASTDNGGTWTTITGSGSIGAGTGGTAQATAWLAIPEAMKTDVVIRVASAGGDGVADPAIQNATLQYRP